MNIKPILTEKSLKLAKSGVYSFWVQPSLTKNAVKKLMETLFEAKTKHVKTPKEKLRKIGRAKKLPNRLARKY